MKKSKEPTIPRFLQPEFSMLQSPERPVTQKVYEQLCEVIPGGVNSPVRSCKSMHQLPMVVAAATEDRLIDVDGLTYIDYCGSWGASANLNGNFITG